jgi:hypothetical protein
LSNIEAYLVAGGNNEDKHFGLPNFWEMIQDKATQVNAELSQQAINCLTSVLKEPFSQPVKITYLLKAIDNLIKGESVPQSVIIAQSIISDYPIASIQEEAASLNISTIITQLQSQVGLVERIIKNLEAYHGAVREKVKVLSDKKKLPEDVANFVFVGKHGHDATFQSLLNFLEFVILSSEERVALGTEGIDRLWALFVQQPNFNSD